MKSIPAETIEAGPLDHLALSPALAFVAPSAAQTFAAEGYDAYNNDLGDVTSATLLSISPDGKCDNSAHTCSSVVADTGGSHHTVTGTDGPATGSSKLTIESSWTACGTAGPVAPGWDWSRHLAGPLSPAAQADALRQWLLIGNGPILLSMSTCTGATADNFQLDGLVAGRPADVQLDSGEFAVFVTTTAGSVFRVNVNPADGLLSLGWKRDLRRSACTADRFDAGAVVQLRNGSSDAFQAHFASDVVYTATDDQCDDHTHNRVFALNATDGSSLWTFNGASLYNVDGISATPTTDAVTDQLYVGGQASSALQTSLYAINVLTGRRTWTDATGSLSAAPVLSGGRVYVANGAGNLKAYDTGGTVIWQLAMPSPPNGDFAVNGAMIAVVMSSGNLARVLDNGTYASELPTMTLATTVDAVTGPTWYAPGGGAQKLYMGGSDGNVWQVDPLDRTELHQAIDTTSVAACCAGALISNPAAAGVTSQAVIFGSTAGDLVKYDVPWTWVGP